MLASRCASPALVAVRPRGDDCGVDARGRLVPGTGTRWGLLSIALLVAWMVAWRLA
jgi:hypothetical protein